MRKYVAGPAEKKSGFWGGERDPHELQAHRHFMEQLEMAVALANREVIHQQIPNLDRGIFQTLAVMVARFRANYLEAAIKLSRSSTPDAALIEELKSKRELFEQGRAAFEALERAIERGYVDVSK
jgi:uncharacterized protein YjaG (DUF416 family)